MEQTEINEGNKLIAIFMGANMPSCQKDKDGNIVSCTLVYNGVRVVYVISAFGEFKFHTSWDWLMPVVEKIGSLESNMCGITVGMFYEGDIVEVWRHVVHFIEWYNKAEIYNVQPH